MASQRTRLVRLLDRGFFPQELPPTFRSDNFSNVIGKFVPAQTYSGSTTFYHGATHQGILRKFGVINPINYYLLSSFIADNWAEFVKTYNLSKSSGTRPKFPALAAEGRAIEVSALRMKRKSQQHLASGYPVIVNLDINRFYGSMYSHSIPWAALGKDAAKKLYAKGKLTGDWSDKLDKFVRNCNQRQTVGIPIGPDTSRIVSELLLSRIDHELCAKGSGISAGQLFHNIDDYNIGALDLSRAEEFQSQFVRILTRYELRLNDGKTSVLSGLDFAVVSQFEISLPLAATLP